MIAILGGGEGDIILILIIIYLLLFAEKFYTLQYHIIVSHLKFVPCNNLSSLFPIFAFPVILIIIFILHYHSGSRTLPEFTFEHDWFASSSIIYICYHSHAVHVGSKLLAKGRPVRVVSINIRYNANTHTNSHHRYFAKCWQL